MSKEKRRAKEAAPGWYGYGAGTGVAQADLNQNYGNQTTNQNLNSDQFMGYQDAARGSEGESSN